MLSHCTPLTNYYLSSSVFLFFSTHLLCLLYLEFKIFSTVLPSLTVTCTSHSPVDGCRVSVPREASTAVLDLSARCGREFIWWWGDTRQLSSCSQVCLRLFLFASLPSSAYISPSSPLSPFPSCYS